ncbi:hypothetical protein BOTCAL_0052g00290 [Botryotinia calthae]|uniref:Uncharacterized protein n=1 Tax=Botryotinia calthae TaxID=38488 RepID=A0A4Y8DB71_9HELO|nr:hypothetical protein BOTCAL_0052g00290 [Botryotinia calthae]
MAFKCQMNEFQSKILSSDWPLPKRVISLASTFPTVIPVPRMRLSVEQYLGPDSPGPRDLPTCLAGDSLKIFGEIMDSLLPQTSLGLLG